MDTMPPSLETRDMRLAVAGALVIQLAVAMSAWRLLSSARDIEPTQQMLAYLVLPSLAAIAWVWFAAVWRQPAGWSGLGFARINRRWFVVSIALGLLSVPAVALLTALTEPLFGPSSGPVLPLSNAQAWGQPSYLLTMLLGVVVLAPIMEEMVFRGLLYGWLRRRLNLWQAGALAAMAHALLHFDLGALPGLFALFLFLAWIYEYSQSLWVPAIIHAAHNFLVLQLP